MKSLRKFSNHENDLSTFHLCGIGVNSLQHSTSFVLTSKSIENVFFMSCIIIVVIGQYFFESFIIEVKSFRCFIRCIAVMDVTGVSVNCKY